MEKKTLPPDVLKFFRETGAQGGKARAQKYSNEELSQWARKGGRPKGSTSTKKESK